MSPQPDDYSSQDLGECPERPGPDATSCTAGHPVVTTLRTVHMGDPLAFLLALPIDDEGYLNGQAEVLVDEDADPLNVAAALEHIAAGIRRQYAATRAPRN